ncbi:hypothetical protein EDC04DRAFT_2200300 [Pisolithus marmoratus]|nr:hypothetical protein EDC04DRAFT_2200300 [Pisolithus marmoratus]
MVFHTTVSSRASAKCSGSGTSPPVFFTARRTIGLSDVALKAMVKSAGGNPQQDEFHHIYDCNLMPPYYGFTLMTHSSSGNYVPGTARLSLQIIYQSLTPHAHPPSTTFTLISRRWSNFGSRTPLAHLATSSQGTSSPVISLAQLCYRLYLNDGSLDYHRWRSPVKGTVVNICRISGATSDNLPMSYYAASLDDARKDLDVVSRS